MYKKMMCCKKVMCLVSFVLVLLLMPTLCTAQQATPENLVLYLPCEDVQNPVDASPDPTTVEVNGTLTTAEGKFGTNGLAFDGNAANRLQVMNAPNQSGMSAVTISAWVIANGGGGRCIVSKRFGGRDNDVYQLFLPGSGIVVGRTVLLRDQSQSWNQGCPGTASQGQEAVAND